MFGQRVLILVPHPDDEVVGAAAAIARARAQGAAVTGVFLTTGVPDADWIPTKARLAARVARRKAEAERAAARLGMTVAAFLPYSSRTLRLHMVQAMTAVEAAVGRFRPEVLWTPAYEGAHQDHDAANVLASRFTGRLPVWEFSEYGYAGGRVLAQTFPEENGTERRLDLSPAEQTEKEALLRLYASETGNLKHVGAGRECFRPLAAYDYTRPPHAGTPFYARFQWVPFRHPRVDFTPPRQVTEDLARFSATYSSESETASMPFSP